MRLKISILFIFFLVPVSGFSVTEGGPTEQLKPVIDELISILADDSLKGNDHKTERREKIMGVISSGFDFREMSRRVLGRTWNELSDNERDYFVTQMTKLLENVYVGKLETYSGETVSFVGERVKGSRAQVTTLITDEQESFPVHYIMQQEQAKWLVYDINIEGVSLVRNYMEQFRTIIRQEQYEGLIKAIEEKNRSFEL
jgi:phospholipid transport system substrate-binding protein